MNGTSDAQQYEMKWKASTDPREGKWPGLRPNEVDKIDGLTIRRDVAVEMRDGVKLYVDIFSPTTSTDQPFPVILTYSPYGKHAPKNFDIFPDSGVPKGSVSRHAVWEGVDPLHWTQRGYTVVNADTRGSWGCEGECTIISPQEAQDGYDVVEWIAKQPWSNGRVGMGGVSYLAIVQWRIAALNPPHLSCIVPWEGFTDVYREYSHHGGIPETNFIKFTEWSCRCGPNRVEDWVAMQKEHYLIDGYQQTRQANLSQIECPAYVVADWGDQGLHTRGTLLGFEKIASKSKWLEIHGRKKWQYFYQPSSLKRQEAFYQKFLKEEPSEVDTWPPVMLEVRERAFEGEIRAESEWPLSRASPRRKYLDGFSGKLVDEMPARTNTASYASTKDGDHLDFTYTFEQATELTGSMALRLWCSTDHVADDMDIFVELDKLSSESNGSDSVVPFVAMSMIDDGPLALGWLRASHRELDPAQSTILRPVHLHKQQMKLTLGQVVPLDIEIWPSSTSFKPGERLRVRIQGNDIFRYDLPQAQLHRDSVNKGQHYIHSGGTYDSYLVLPVIE